MKYFFALGNNPTLSIAELSAIFPYAKNQEIINKNIFILKTTEEIDVQSLIKKIGGTIKIGVIKHNIENANSNNVLEHVQNLIATKNIEGKFKFGISCYGKKKFKTNLLAMNIKKYLKENKISCRWVISREPILSSVIIEQNKLINKGIEFVLIEQNNELLIGKTLAVQAFKELSKRDYGRPARDDQSGMLPPKLAQIMINLSRSKNQENNKMTILDPFCGSGTVLTESMLMDYQNLIGSDLSKKAINDTEQNIKWTEINYQLSIINYQLLHQSATELSKLIKPKSVDAIITEPYLGPQRGEFNIEQTIKELEKLYSQSLFEFQKILKPDGCVVMIWPVFNIKNKTQHISPNINNFKIKNPIPKELQNNQVIKLTKRNTIIYGRDGQKIWREIVILKNTS